MALAGKESGVEAEEVIARMMEVLQVSTQKELAERLKVRKPVISQWKSRGTVSLQACMIVAEEQNVDLKWLLTGLGKMRPDEQNMLTQKDREFLPSIEEVIRAVKLGNLGITIKMLEYALEQAKNKLANEQEAQ